MRHRPLFAGLSIGLLLCLCGCYHHSYSPYAAPYGTYPSAPSGGYAVPSTPYVPNTGPPGSSPTPTPITPDWQPPANNGAPPYNPTPGGNSNNGMVPEPVDDKPFGGGTPGASLSPNIEPIPLGQNNSPNPSGIELQPIEAEPPYSPNGSTASLRGNESAEQFEPPVMGNSSAVSARPVTMSQSQNPNLKPYGYETRNYSWLRGIIEYDPLDNRWVMIYSAPPNPKDRYGGTLTLADHPSFRNISPGTHLYVQGSLDQSSLDQHGKPLYQIEKVKLLSE